MAFNLTFTFSPSSDICVTVSVLLEKRVASFSIVRFFYALEFFSCAVKKKKKSCSSSVLYTSSLNFIRFFFFLSFFPGVYIFMSLLFLSKKNIYVIVPVFLIFPLNIEQLLEDAPLHDITFPPSSVIISVSSTFKYVFPSLLHQPRHLPASGRQSLLSLRVHAPHDLARSLPYLAQRLYGRRDGDARGGEERGGTFCE